MKKLIITTIIIAICCAQYSASAATQNGNSAADYLVLRGTLFTSSNRPVAMIEDTRSSMVSMCEIGEIYNALYVEDITRGEVVLSSPAGEVRLLLPSGAVVFAGDNLADEENWYNVRKEGDTYIVDADTVTNAICRAKQILRNVKLSPCFQGGLLSGLKVSKLKQVGILKEIGVEEGDVVKTVNGYKITTPFQIYKAYNKLRHKSEIEVQVIRNNQPFVLNYRITK
ncbi:MAG: hypothetical protein ABIB11_03850 [Candidatus Omnitrophota bacterium]